ncbi:MAG: lycopene cyclase [Anaerolineae bacterium]|nr:lycopene cyclase [Anaerolineae bacterium]
METPFDYIIAGAGASGLSLAYHLNQAGLTDKRILLVDKAPKTTNDRTWCFWEAGQNPFEHLLYRQWRKLNFYAEGIAQSLNMGPYAYKMLRGIDFYTFMNDWLAQQPNITRLFGEVTGVSEIDTGANVCVNGTEYTALFAFNSILRPMQYALRNTQHSLLQHFKGWVIETEEDAFDPEAATLMDFRVPQTNGATCFVYTMPFSPRTALVEYTVFGPSLWPADEYRRELRRYLSSVLKLDEYQIHEEETGVIPMTDAPFETRPSPHVVNIGTAGGRTKPSTGYTFLRIQQQAMQLASALKHTGQPGMIETPLRFKRYDSTLLNVLAKHRREGARVFAELYARNPAWRIFKFLDEQTSLAEDLQVMTSTHLPTFTKAALDVVTRKLR